MSEVSRWKVLQAWAATILVGTAAKYGLKLTEDQAGLIVLLFGSAAMKWAHNRLTPTDSPRVSVTQPLIPGPPEQPPIRRAD